ncbi:MULTISPECIES: prepilin-type cleavage/methylation domain-containing protein [unclassified Gemella]|uniref:prepilin-type cleavage/methylation domain-containing protein n=1 Tax=unclassified Gemella TaxID=2624949 RepID=UPI001C043A53|nr:MULTISPECIES: prepilin-type cleavage/methylation domain-containing protein [unclassified Gemella]MBU0278922.1 prepilin-type cleavage/methylation domain-containing protein [Gemella sp. zg-1178]QWQ38478.1 prepilin-type cleavage/methylation domain-containing protein [Gemella sp. zg-570]
MAKLDCKNNQGFSFVEVLGVLFIVCSVIFILSLNPVASYEKYKEKVAVNELISNIYMVQTKSLTDSRTNYIEFFENANEYRMYYDGKSETRHISENGKTGVGLRSLQFRYRRGNVNRANTVLVNFPNSRYEIIIHLETGYVTLNEK